MKTAYSWESLTADEMFSRLEEAEREQEEKAAKKEGKQGYRHSFPFPLKTITLVPHAGRGKRPKAKKMADKKSQVGHIHKIIILHYKTPQTLQRLRTTASTVEEPMKMRMMREKRSGLDVIAAGNGTIMDALDWKGVSEEDEQWKCPGCQ